MSTKEIDELLADSKLVEKCIQEFERTPLSVSFRLISLSEIPYIERLSYVQELLCYANENIATEDGFSPLGGINELVPCYNAMLLEAYCRLGLSKSTQAQSALNWIKRYQLFERNQKTNWRYKGICKHGRCLGKVPCYIGIGKTIRALLTYKEIVGLMDDDAERCLQRGIEYMLCHHMY